MHEPNPAGIMDCSVASASSRARLRVVRLLLAVLVAAVAGACGGSLSKSHRLSSDSRPEKSRGTDAAGGTPESAISVCPLKLTVRADRDVVVVSSDSSVDARAELHNVSDHPVSVYGPGLTARADIAYPDVHDEVELNLDPGTTVFYGDEHGPPYPSDSYAWPSGDRRSDFCVLGPGDCLEFRLTRPMHETASVTWVVQYVNTDAGADLDAPAWTGEITGVRSGPISVIFDDGSLKHFSEIIQGSQETESRRIAANILSGQSGHKEKVIPVLLNAMLNDGDKSVRAAAAQGIAYLARQELGLPSETEDFSKVRKWAAWFLSTH